MYDVRNKNDTAIGHRMPSCLEYLAPCLAGIVDQPQAQPHMAMERERSHRVSRESLAHVTCSQHKSEPRFVLQLVQR